MYLIQAFISYSNGFLGTRSAYLRYGRLLISSHWIMLLVTSCVFAPRFGFLHTLYHEKYVSWQIYVVIAFMGENHQDALHRNRITDIEWRHYLRYITVHRYIPHSHVYVLEVAIWQCMQCIRHPGCANLFIRKTNTSSAPAAAAPCRGGDAHVHLSSGENRMGMKLNSMDIVSLEDDPASLFRRSPFKSYLLKLRNVSKMVMWF